MLGALLLGAARGMERVGEQQESRDEAWFFGAEHAGLASAVGMACEEDALLLAGRFPTSRNIGEKWGTPLFFSVFFSLFFSLFCFLFSSLYFYLVSSLYFLFSCLFFCL